MKPLAITIIVSLAVLIIFIVVDMATTDVNFYKYEWTCINPNYTFIDQSVYKSTQLSTLVWHRCEIVYSSFVEIKDSTVIIEREKAEAWLNIFRLEQVKRDSIIQSSL